MLCTWFPWNPSVLTLKLVKATRVDKAPDHRMLGPLYQLGVISGGISARAHRPINTWSSILSGKWFDPLNIIPPMLKRIIFRYKFFHRLSFLTWVSTSSSASAVSSLFPLAIGAWSKSSWHALYARLAPRWGRILNLYPAFYLINNQITAPCREFTEILSKKFNLTTNVCIEPLGNNEAKSVAGIHWLWLSPSVALLKRASLEQFGH